MQHGTLWNPNSKYQTEWYWIKCLKEIQKYSQQAELSSLHGTVSLMFLWQVPFFIKLHWLTQVSVHPLISHWLHLLWCLQTLVMSSLGCRVPYQPVLTFKANKKYWHIAFSGNHLKPIISIRFVKLCHWFRVLWPILLNILSISYQICR